MGANSKIEWTDATWFHPEGMDAPLRWKRPRKIFVNSLSDMFHDDVPSSYIAKIFATMYEAQWHTFQVLTKRPERMATLLSDPRFHYAIGCRSWARMSPEKQAVLTREEIIHDVMDGWPLRNVWIGVTAENQKRADERIPHLLATPAIVRFLSIEPLLGAMDLKFWNPANPQSEGEWMASVEGVGVIGKNRPVDWVIVGGESGPNARPTHPDWVRSIRDQCQAADVPFFFKQWGEWYPIHGTGRLSGDEEDEGEHPWTWLTPSGERCQSGKRPDALMIRSGKKFSGRLLDGREWSEFPEVSHAQ